MIRNDQTITLEWLDYMHEVLTQANNFMNLQTADVLMNLAEMQVVKKDHLEDLKIRDILGLIGIAKEAVLFKKEAEKVKAIHVGAGGKHVDHEDHPIEAVILPFRQKVGRHYYNRLQ